jgi:hypothetical protein
MLAMQKTMNRIPVALLAAMCLVGTPQLVPQTAAQSVAVPAAAKVTSPKEQFGFNYGDDYQLASYKQISDYWKKLDAESDRMIVQDIGPTAEGRRQLMAIVTSPANHRNLARYKDISRRLALADGLTDDAARALAKEGKAVVWIDGGLHASEVLGAQQLGEMVYQMVSMNDEETLRILDNVIIVFVHANPDGNDLTAEWYMRNPVPNQRSNAPGLPKLYQKYIGHDNNRDFFGSTQPETENMNRVMYREWFPQIVYNHHQTGPAGTVMFAPPFRDPFNFNFDPMIPVGIDLVGAAMHTRFAAEGKGGITSRSGSSYSTWWNGGLRTTAYFHNMIGLLTETIGNPTPVQIPFIARQQLPRADLPFPIAPQEWHFRQSIDYSVTANRAVLDLASKMHENFLFNIYRMGKNSIERGNRDTWTISPRRLAALGPAANAGGGRGAGGGGGGGGRGGNAAGNPADNPQYKALRAPELRDPRAFILSASQPDFPTVTKFINALLETGITVHQATAPFTSNGKSYPTGSFVVSASQPFRPHVMDMFEPQDHPDDFPYPGAAPTPPYDNAGWTLAYEMGVQFDRVLDSPPNTASMRKVDEWNLKAPAGKVATASRAAGYFTSHEVNDAFNAVNKLLRANEDVYWLRSPVTANGKTYPAGTLYIASRGSTLPALQKIATDLGVSFDATSAKPAGDALKLKKARIGLWDTYGGSQTAGWNRWILEQFDFDFTRVFPPQLDAGNLNAKYDVLIFSGGIPGMGGAGGGRGGRGGGGGAPGGDESPGAGAGGGGAGQFNEADLPAEYRNQRGSVTTDRTMPIIKQFIENGGTVIVIGSTTANMVAQLGLPVTDHLVENGQPLPRTKFYVPGSVLRVRTDPTQPVMAGLPEYLDVFFDNSATFKLGADAATRGVKSLAWYENKTPLRSGWAWGQNYLENGVAMLEANVGKGKVFLFGPEITQRGQTHGTFKLLFNSIYYGSATPMRM